MAGKRLAWEKIEEVLRRWPGDACDLVLELREFVLQVAPEASEKIAFHSLCYYKAEQPYGVIGGNVCMIGVRDDCVLLGFIHGAALPDPDGLLQGDGKAARHIVIRHSKDIKRRALKKLIRAAAAYDPSASA